MIPSVTLPCFSTYTLSGHDNILVSLMLTVKLKFWLEHIMNQVDAAYYNGGHRSCGDAKLMLGSEMPHGNCGNRERPKHCFCRLWWPPTINRIYTHVICHIVFIKNQDQMVMCLAPLTWKNLDHWHWHFMYVQCLNTNDNIMAYHGPRFQQHMGGKKETKIDDIGDMKKEKRVSDELMNGRIKCRLGVFNGAVATAMPGWQIGRNWVTPGC